jgi:predicted nucleic-acid-binding Zn-ribbon protein
LEGEPAGAWLCTGCGNVNFKHRDYCNTKVCGLPHPDRMAVPMMGGAHMGKGMPMMMPMPMPQAFESQMVAAVAGAKLDWTCSSCGNLNYGSREICNTRKCQAQRPPTWPIWQQPATDASHSDWVCPGCGNVNFAKRDICNTRTCQMPRQVSLWSGQVVPLKGKSRGKGGSGQRTQPNLAVERSGPGDWTCPGCGNVNYSIRDVCNTRTCRLPRPEGLM